MMDARDIIIRPVITEQSINDMDEGKYTFIVNKKANKTHIKHAVKDIFEVEVKKVNTINTTPKPKTMGMGRFPGYSKSLKKAIVTLKDPSAEIDVFSEGTEED
ncbi:MAG: 50S ribosomal protein L23 [Atopostipes sp.]|nr:50S ribosomal protein L23 [Atopostipes sp.]